MLCPVCSGMRASLIPSHPRKFWTESALDLSSHYINSRLLNYRQVFVWRLFYVDCAYTFLGQDGPRMVLFYVPIIVARTAYSRSVLAHPRVPRHLS
jgi:hypothetical protein